MTTIAPLPTSDVDLFTDDVLHNPYPALRELRDAGPAVRLTSYDAWVLPRYEHVRAALADHERFSSAHGVGYEDQFNAQMKGTVLASDPPDHTRLRALLSDKLAPRALAKLRTRMSDLADDLVADAVAKGGDAVTDLAAVFPVTVVADLIGLTEEARGPLLSFADAAFNTFGPFNARAQASIPFVGQMFEYLNTVMVPENLRPDGWAAAVHQAADRGDVEAASVVPLLSAYVIASMDTTSSGDADHHGDALGLGQDMQLAAGFAAVHRVRPGQRAPHFARTEAASTITDVQSNSPRAPSSSSTARCSRRHSPAFVQAEKRRGQLDVAAAVRVSERSVERWCQSGESAARSGSRCRVPRARLGDQLGTGALDRGQRVTTMGFGSERGARSTLRCAETVRRQTTPAPGGPTATPRRCATAPTASTNKPRTCPSRSANGYAHPTPHDLVPRQATFAPSRRPARTLAVPAESPSTSSTRASGRHAESTHRTPLLDGQTSPAAALAPPTRWVS
jgi:hypothetical protein